MSTIIIKDTLRQSVEAASGGAQTVLYTAKGQPSFVNIIPKVTLDSLGMGAGTHPAFIVDGKEIPQLFIGTYQGVIKNGEFLSLPFAAPTFSNPDNYIYYNTAKACGPGWHAITAAEWALLAIQTFRAGTQPLGNTFWGFSSDDMSEFGQRVDGRQPGDKNNTTGVTYTGSGPVDWRHDRTFSGISDLCGNIAEYTYGVRMMAGELQFLANNDAALYASNISPSSPAWKAMDALTGELITPTFTGTVEGGDYVATTPTSVRFALSSSNVPYSITVSGTMQAPFGSISTNSAKPVAEAALQKLKALALYPFGSDSSAFKGDCVWSTGISANRALLSRSGHNALGASAGIFAMEYGRDGGGYIAGSRPVYYKPLS
ncbi:hypothetical protein ACN4EX_15600 [Klebsiella pneumoniae]|uniref:hypothetical protein n=1 Tax=Klebsiella pneumoniae TaxID=573 RepID=UPI0039BA0148|nr:hypothetical protein [Klebsiella pneumoniae]